MSYKALYRKFRPDHFDDVKGQEHIVTTLKNQIRSGRIGHAYLFCGTRGTGKTTIAKLFAKTVNCENPVQESPCGICSCCKAIAAGASMNVIEIDAASNNGVDNIREIVEEVSYSPAEGKYKVYIIDEVHMLSIGAFNALLKTLEEPPSYVIFILATTEVHKIPITILSRCQRYDFRRITIDTITDLLCDLMKQEANEVEEKALRFIARTADGSMRDALSLLDQCIAFHYGEVLTYDKVLDVLGAVDTEVFSRLLRLLLERDVPGCIMLLEEIVMQGRELLQFVTDFTWYLRNLMLLKASEGTEDIMEVSSENLKRLKEEAGLIQNDQIFRYIRLFSELSAQIKYASAKRIFIEILLIKICRPQMDSNTDALTDRIREMEEKIKSGELVSQPVTVKAESKPKIFPKAVPDDIKEIVKKWPAIINNAESPLKIYLKNAKLSLGGDNRLMLVVQDLIAGDYLTKYPDHKKQVESLITDYSGKEIEILIQIDEEERNFEDNYVDLTKLIHMEIEEEE